MNRLLVLALFCGCASDTDAIYEDPQGGYTVRYPSGWKVEQEVPWLCDWNCSCIGLQ